MARARALRTCSSAKNEARGTIVSSRSPARSATLRSKRTKPERSPNLASAPGRSMNKHGFCRVPEFKVVEESLL